MTARELMGEPDIAALVADVNEATAELAQRQQEQATAQRAESDARNRLNATQKRLDDAMATLRARAPEGSEWQRRDAANIPTRGVTS